MRKLFTTFIVALISFCSVYADNNSISLKTGLSAHDHPLDNGFLIRLGFGVPGASYGDRNHEDYNPYNYNGEIDEVNMATSIGIELGNQFYVWRESSETMGLAVNINWMDLQLGFGTVDYYNTYDSGTDVELLINLSLIEVGPLYTYALNDDMGIDAYFNLCPTLLVSAWYEDAGIGLRYAVGGAFRWKVLSAGLEYGFGDVKMMSDSESPNYRVNTGMIKINIGVKL